MGFFLHTYAGLSIFPTACKSGISWSSSKIKQKLCYFHFACSCQGKLGLGMNLIKACILRWRD